MLNICNNFVKVFTKCIEIVYLYMEANYMKLLFSLFLIATSALAGTTKAYFAGGCFWCVEPPFNSLEGVKSTRVGFSGGTIKDPSYKQVSSGSTEYVESLEVEYDPEKLSFKDLTYVFFKTMDPTDNKGQFVDRGKQYRPVAYYQTEDEKKIIEAYIKELENKKVYKKTITIEISKHTTFYPAEDYHQKYYLKNPIRYNYYRYRSGRDDFLESVWGKKFKENLKKKFKQKKN